MDKIKCVVMLPTYNEAGNIEPLTRKIISLGPDISVVVVDDDSDDGTPEIVESLGKECGRIDLIRRKGKKGRGLSGREGYKAAIRKTPEYIVEMDADLSHDPVHIPAMLEAMKECDMVIGSRFVPGGLDERRSVIRKGISRFAKYAINLILGLNVTDPTSGFRCFSRSLLEKIDPETLKSDTPFIVLETLCLVARSGATIKEIPITFHPRGREESKFNLFILVSCLLDVILYRIRGVPGRWG